MSDIHVCHYSPYLRKEKTKSKHIFYWSRSNLCRREYRLHNISSPFVSVFSYKTDESFNGHNCITCRMCLPDCYRCVVFYVLQSQISLCNCCIRVLCGLRFSSVINSDSDGPDKGSIQDVLYTRHG